MEEFEADPFSLEYRGSRCGAVFCPGQDPCLPAPEMTIPFASSIVIASEPSPSSRKMNYEERIVKDPGICGGEPVIRGTRVTLRTVLASLAEGATIQQIVEDFPTLTEEDVRSVIAFAAASAEEDMPLRSVPSVG
jgi:uncharacterized protein (DUF433 family)